jgi:prepilin-type N-terminal cleavage/methylation domain-containing protein
MMDRAGDSRATDSPITRRQAKRRAESGFSLIELMITVMVFVIGLVAVLSSISGMIRQQELEGYKSVSSTYMKYILGDLQDFVATDSDNDIASVMDYTHSEYGALFAAPVTVSLPGINRPVEISMQRMDVGPDPNPTEVEVSVTFLAPSGHLVTYATSQMIRWNF